jgi:hypothetical protein
VIKPMPMPIPTIQNDHTAKFMRLAPSTCLVWMNDGEDHPTDASKLTGRRL